jgi:hypothetical protein
MSAGLDAGLLQALSRRPESAPVWVEIPFAAEAVHLEADDLAGANICRHNVLPGLHRLVMARCRQQWRGRADSATRFSSSWLRARAVQRGIARDDDLRLAVRIRLRVEQLRPTPTCPLRLTNPAARLPRLHDFEKITAITSSQSLPLYPAAVLRLSFLEFRFYAMRQSQQRLLRGGRVLIGNDADQGTGPCGRSRSAHRRHLHRPVEMVIRVLCSDRSSREFLAQRRDESPIV